MACTALAPSQSMYASVLLWSAVSPLLVPQFHDRVLRLAQQHNRQAWGLWRAAVTISNISNPLGGRDLPRPRLSFTSGQPFGPKRRDILGAAFAAAMGAQTSIVTSRGHHRLRVPMHCALGCILGELYFAGDCVPFCTSLGPADRPLQSCDAVLRFERP